MSAIFESFDAITRCDGGIATRPLMLKRLEAKYLTVHEWNLISGGVPKHGKSLKVTHKTVWI